MSTVRVIDAEHVKLALVTHLARRHLPTLARFSALSNGTVGTSCRYRVAPQADAPRSRPLLYPLLTSITPSLVERTRAHYGVTEIQRTWGVGYRAMLAQLNGGGA